MSKSPQDIEEQLKQAIQTCGLRAYHLARISGVAQPILSNFVNGKRSVTLPTAVKLARALGLEFHQVAPVRKRRKGR
jgi:plasmid maintenance system antidote protein VapI